MTTRHAFGRCLAVLAAMALCTVGLAAQKKVRIIQTNSAGDNVHIIDPATNKVVGVIEGIEVSHGAGVAPDGSRIYVSNEAESTLDFVDAKTLKVIKTRPAERPSQQHGGRRRRQEASTSASSRRRAAST